MYGVLTVTHGQLKSFPCDIELPEDLLDLEYLGRVINRQKQLVLNFHEFMTRGQSFGTVNVEREEFYKRVIVTAKEVRFFLLHDFCNRNLFKFNRESIKHSPAQYVDRGGKGVRTVGKALCKFVDPRGILSYGDRRLPLVLLSFDEPNILMDSLKGGEWTLFSELRRILQCLEWDNHSIFSVFLSTAGNFRILSPNVKSGPSRRVVTEYLRPFRPITNISFDCLARPAVEYSVTLNEVVQMSWIAHLGRPLYAPFVCCLGKLYSCGVDSVLTLTACPGLWREERATFFTLQIGTCWTESISLKWRTVRVPSLVLPHGLDSSSMKTRTLVMWLLSKWSCTCASAFP